MGRPSPDLRARGLVPLWEVATNLVRNEPVPSCAPHCWKYSSVRSALMSVGDSISAEEAERRVLLLGNPYFEHPATTATLIAGFQMIKSGEVACSHRHTQAALRLVIEGAGAYTAVNGERFPMNRGDLILTPSWTWHDHENCGDGPMIWLDGLDVPLMGKLAVSFYEGFGGGRVPQSRPVGFSPSTYGRGLTPVDGRFAPHVSANVSAPELHYLYRDARHALSLMTSGGAPDPVDAYKLRYTNSQTGGNILPSIAAWLQALPKGFVSSAMRQTDAEIFVVLEGEGMTTIGDVDVSWVENDVFVVPNWTWRSHRAASDAVLFSFSDRALQEALGIHRDERAH